MEKEKFKLELGGRDLIIEIRNLAELTNGNVLVTYGETTVLATCCSSKEEKDKDFFPLTVEYEEKFYAAGRIGGSRYLRREGRPSDEATLTARLIDRAIRPRFPKNFKNEVQVIITVLSWDGQNDPSILGLFAASLALSISDIPWSGPLGVIKVGKTGNNFILNPIYEVDELRSSSSFANARTNGEKNQTEIVFAGLETERDILINMIEGQMEEEKEETISESWNFAKKYIKILIDFQKEIINKTGKKKFLVEPILIDSAIEKEIKEFLGEKLENVLFQPFKTERMEEVNNLKKDLSYFIKNKYLGEEGIKKEKYAMIFFEQEIKKLIQENIIQKNRRVDNRKVDEIRKIECEAGLLPRTHGSGLFQRGQTKSLSILTLGSPGDTQLLDVMKGSSKKRFMHHYNFPPYSVGEIKPMRGPARRDIGHGMLAEKALFPLIPDFDKFPYTIRIVTEILSSNGSTSMASVSSSSLALMDAGVPIKTHIAGIAIGLVKDKNENYKILADIQGPEDHNGDMDFKVAGTKEGVTAIQMDIKIDGINEKMLKEVLELGRQGRIQIIEKMEKVLSKPRPQLSPYAPKILTIQINPEKIKDVIGPGGKIINEIVEKCKVAIDIEQSGLIFITGEKEENVNKALEKIKDITREAKIGEIFQGKVVRITDFGAFVEIFPNQDGLVHISQLAPYRVNKVEDVVKINDIIPVKVISIDEQGRIKLSLKDAKKN
jgi:polyribonucleotide nucleotidyltransferase